MAAHSSKVASSAVDNILVHTAQEINLVHEATLFITKLRLFSFNLHPVRKLKLAMERYK